MNDPEITNIVEAYKNYNNSKSNQKFNYNKYRLISDETFIKYSLSFDDVDNAITNDALIPTSTDNFYNNALIKSDLEGLDLYLLKSGEIDIDDIAIGNAWISEIYIFVEDDCVCLYINDIDGEELGTIDFPLSDVRYFKQKFVG